MRPPMVFAAVAILLLPSPSDATVAMSTDLVSRYVWRGTDIGDSPGIQSGLEISRTVFKFGTFIAGVWGSCPIASRSGANEIDTYIGHHAGSLYLTLVDYYNPANGDLFDLDDDTTAHDLELNVGLVDLSDLYPKLSVLAGWSIEGGVMVAGADPANSMFLELGIPVVRSGGRGAYNLTAWIAAGNERYREDGDFGLVSVALQVVALEKRISLAYTLNPDTETSYLVLKKELPILP